MNKFVKHLPDITTMINAVLGLTAILLLSKTAYTHKVLIAALLVGVGGIIDFFDGFLAKKLNAVSIIGKYLDSFADMITFGIAPIFLINYITAHKLFWIVSMVSGLFIVSGIYRLARHNTGDYKSYFLGLPITAAGMILAAYGAIVINFEAYMNSTIYLIATSILLVALSIMMISRIRIRRVI